MEEQPIPEDTCCPDCGGDPLDNPSHNLSAIGYTHDDILLTCSDCQNQWLCGVPIGESDYGEDLRCSCGEIGYPHKIDTKNLPDELLIHMKCLNCTHFYDVERELDRNKNALVGHPELTGSMEDLDEQHF